MDSFSKKHINLSMVLCLISTGLLLFGFIMPVIDFSYFHPAIDIQYNLIKVCKNVRLISSVWTALPVGFIIGIVLLGLLSFVRIPQFRLIPCTIIIAMFVIILIDINNLIVWANDALGEDMIMEMINMEIVIDRAKIIKSVQPGVYFMGAGLVLGIVSSFIKSDS